MFYVSFIIITLPFILTTNKDLKLFHIKEEDQILLKDMYYKKNYEFLTNKENIDMKINEDFDKNSKNLWYTILNDFMKYTEIAITPDDAFVIFNEVNTTLNEEFFFALQLKKEYTVLTLLLLAHRLDYLKKCKQENIFSIDKITLFISESIEETQEPKSIYDIATICKTNLETKLRRIKSKTGSSKILNSKNVQADSLFEEFDIKYLNMTVAFFKRFFEIVLKYDIKKLATKGYFDENHTIFYIVDPEYVIGFLNLIQEYRYNSLLLFYTALVMKQYK